MKKSIIRTLFVFGLILVLGLSASCKKNKTYSIEYELNGGVLTSAPTEYDGKSKVTLPTPTKEGETFAGWFDNAGFNGSAVYEIAKGSTGDKKFYAKWNTQDGGGEGGGRKWELNRFGFDGGGMKYVIKVLPVSEFDPFSADYSGSKKALKQSHQRDVEEAYNIKIEYSAWDNDAQWGPTRVDFIKKSFQDQSFLKKNVYAVNITSQWIPTLVKAQCLAELYDYNKGVEDGIFKQLDYTQDSAINEATAVKKKVYGYDPGTVRPDYFLYYNATKVAEIGVEDPAEMWFKGEWTWSNFDAWVKDAQLKLGDGEYVLDSGYAEFIIGAAPAQGAKLVNASKGAIMFTKNSVTSILDKMVAYYKGGYWNTKHGTNDVTAEFNGGKTLIASGTFWFLKNETRFLPTNEFKVGVVPYPMDDNTTVAPYTAPYTYEDTQGNTVSVDEPLKTRFNETLTTDDGQPVYGVDLSQSNFLLPYTGGSCYSIMNFSSASMNTATAFSILHDLLADMPEDPADAGITNDEAYRLTLSKKLDYEIDVNVMMSAQQAELYYELMEVLSMTVGGGSHFGTNGFWPLASGLMTNEKTPATKLKEVEDVYKQALIDLGY